MGIIRWLKAYGRRRAAAALKTDELRLSTDLRTVRLARAVRDFPGRTSADLARIIYGRASPELVDLDLQTLEAVGLVARDPETGRLYPS